MAETPRRLRDISGSNALQDFRSEDEPIVPTTHDKPRARVVGSHPSPAGAFAPAARVPVRKRRRLTMWWILGVALAVIAAGTVVIFFRPGVLHTQLQNVEAPDVRPGQVTLDTVPSGVEVLIDGQVRGATPLTVPLPPGHHDVVLRNGTEERTVPLEMSAGAQIIQRVEFAASPVSVTKLSVITEPPGARVVIDGETRGVSPVTVEDLSVGRHRIAVTAAGGSSERMVTTEAGTTTSVVFSLAKPAGLDAGWLSITSPFEVKVMERQELIGTSDSPKIMIPAGSHEVDLVNEALGYQNHRKIDIESGKTALVRVDARASLNANARPWAEVVIDGTSVGVTPIANHVLSLGNHQVVFRHPQFGERRQDIVVTMQGPNRVSVDMAAK